MDKALADARRDLAERQESATPIVLATVASLLLSRQFRVRTSTIAQTETQESAEATKQIEASVAAGASPFVTAPTLIEVPDDIPDVTKTWVDFGDNRVRQSHVIVNGTTLPEDGIFNVGGSRLRFPADTSLSASTKEIINCRCSSQYSLT